MLGKFGLYKLTIGNNLSSFSTIQNIIFGFLMLGKFVLHELIVGNQLCSFSYSTWAFKYWDLLYST